MVDAAWAGCAPKARPPANTTAARTIDTEVGILLRMVIPPLEVMAQHSPAVVEVPASDPRQIDALARASPPHHSTKHQGELYFNQVHPRPSFPSATKRRLR
jgi:hypothetical protein